MMHVIQGYISIPNLLGNPHNVHKHKNHYIINYFHNNEEYKILYKVVRRKKKIITDIKNELDESVFDKINMFLGFNQDFHNMIYTPKDLGFTELKFYFITDEIKIFKEDENIILY